MNWRPICEAPSMTDKTSKIRLKPNFRTTRIDHGTSPRNDKSCLIWEGIFNLVPSSKYLTKSLSSLRIPQPFHLNLGWKVEDRDFVYFLVVRTKLKKTSKIKSPLFRETKYIRFLWKTTHLDKKKFLCRLLLLNCRFPILGFRSL